MGPRIRLAIHDYMSTSPTFDAYLTTSPAVGWNHDELIEKAPHFFSAEGVPRPLYVGGAGRDFPGNLDAIRRFASAVDSVAPNSARFRFSFFEDDSHYSLVHRATYEALGFLYEGWQVPPDVASRADFAELERHYAELSERYGYALPIPMQSVVRLENQLLREKRWEDGIAVLERNIELYPDQPESYWHVGDAHVLAGHLERARPYFERALRAATALGVPDVDDYRRSLEALDSP